MTQTATHQPMREPLEHFVILQLSEIRERESRLRKTLEELSNADATVRSEVLATELMAAASMRRQARSND